MNFSELITTYLPKGSLRARVAGGAFWYLVGNVVAQGGGLLGSILSARILGKVSFGELGMIRSTVLMFGVLAGAGLGMVTTKYVAEYRIKDPIKTGRMIGLLINTAVVLGGGVALLFSVFATPMAKWLLNAPHLSGAMKVGCFLFLLNTLNGVQLGAISGFEAFRTQSLMIVLDGIFNLTFIPAGAFLYGVGGAVGGTVAAALLGFVVKQLAMNRECRRADIKVVRRNVSAELPVLWKFALPAVLVGVSLQPFEWLARLLVANGPNGYAELGLFTAAYTWSFFILFLPGQISGPTQTILANLVSMGQKEQVKSVLVYGNLIVIAAATVFGLIVILFSDVIMSAYGSGYKEGSKALFILSIGSVFYAASQIFKNFLYAIDRVWMVVIAQLIMGIGLCFFSLIFQKYGANGLASSYVIGWLVLTLLVSFFSATSFKKLSATLEQGNV